MTESEAKTKWCPMVRLSTLGGGNVVFNASENQRAHCVGSDCMMWREYNYEVWNEDAPPKKTGIGYCGLAGKL